MKIAIMGGDKRMLFAARAFADEGHEVYAAGFDTLQSLCEIRLCTVEEAARQGEIIILPVRPLKDDGLFAPFSRQRIGVAGMMKLIGEKPVFSGCADWISPYASAAVYDYTTREDFSLRNAQLTAEGAVGLLVNDYEGSIGGACILVTGYGRIGKALSAYLKAMGAQVTSAARKPFDRLTIESRGMTAVDFPDVDWSAYPVIINTVPALVMAQDAVDRMRQDVFIIDLASAPGGVDFQRAKQRDLTCIHALSLPGKTAPLAAGTVIKDTIMQILSRR